MAPRFHPLCGRLQIGLVLLVLSLPAGISANDDVAHVRPIESEQQPIGKDPLTVRALTRLEKRLDIQFNTPFPDDIDIDKYRKRPLAVMPLDDSKVFVSRPIVNPFDEPRAVEWMIGRADPAKLPNDSVECSIELDERGQFSRVNLLADWADDENESHQMERGERESGAVFFARACATYRSMAKKADDRALAELLLRGFEKVATAIQKLREEEAQVVP